MNAPSRIRTFGHRFKGGITCELAVDLDKLAAKAADPMRCEWSARPKPRVIPEYRRWTRHSWIMSAAMQRRAAGLTTCKQVRTLRKFGVPAPHLISFKRASAILDRLFSERFSKGTRHA